MRPKKREVIKADERHPNDVASEVSVGIREILRSPSVCWGVLWTVVFLFLLCVCALNLYHNIASYLSYQSHSTIREEFFSSLAYPRVTVCLSSWILQEKFQRDYPDPQDRKYITEHFEFFTEVPPIERENLSFNPTQFIDNYGISCDNLTAGCYANIRRAIHLDCCSFVSAKFIAHGKLCYSFDIPSHQNVSGVFGAYSMNFYQPKYKESACNFETAECDWDMSVSDNSTGLFFNELTYSILREDKVTFFQLHKVIAYNLPPPYGSCDPGRSLKYFSSYTREFCISETRVSTGVEKCGCVKYGELTTAQDASNLTACTPKQNAECYEMETGNVMMDCPPACVESGFRIQRTEKR